MQVSTIKIKPNFVLACPIIDPCIHHYIECSTPYRVDTIDDQCHVIQETRMPSAYHRKVAMVTTDCT